MRRTLLGLTALLFLDASPSPAQAPGVAALTPGVHQQVKFSLYPAEAEGPLLIRRLLSPLASEIATRNLKASGRQLAPRTVDLDQASFSVFVPKVEPAAGYGVMVFVSPSEKAIVPPGWASVLDRHGIIFVSADQSGNDEAVIERRVPLALIALANIEARFRINPDRRIIAGFSGGSRVALRIALDFPDRFNAALLNAGSDPIGTRALPLPSAALLERVRDHSRFALVTGDRDEGSRQLDDASAASLRHWCVSGVEARLVPGEIHEYADAQELERALGALEENGRRSPDVDRCRTERANDMAAAFSTAEAAIARKDGPEARRLLLDIDARYGGVAAQRVIELTDRCGCGLLPEPRIAILERKNPPNPEKAPEMIAAAIRDR